MLQKPVNGCEEDGRADQAGRREAAEEQLRRGTLLSEPESEPRLERSSITTQTHVDAACGSDTDLSDLD